MDVWQNKEHLPEQVPKEMYGREQQLFYLQSCISSRTWLCKILGFRGGDYE